MLACRCCFHGRTTACWKVSWPTEVHRKPLANCTRAWARSICCLPLLKGRQAPVAQLTFCVMDRLQLAACARSMQHFSSASSTALATRAVRKAPWPIGVQLQPLATCSHAWARSFGPSQLAISSSEANMNLLSSIGECSSLQLPFTGQAVCSEKLFYSLLVAYQASSSHPAFTGKTTFRPLFYQFRGCSTIKLGRRHHWAIWLRGERLLVGKYDKRQKAARNAQPRSRQRSASPNNAISSTLRAREEATILSSTILELISTAI